tara:strand:- start:1055 stop:1807 length:753 start_codon:yes stop_codon:yes gene_type:complete
VGVFYLKKLGGEAKIAQKTNGQSRNKWCIYIKGDYFKMATIDFLINRTGFDYDLKLGGSGLAFFGDAGFGASVEVGKYQGTTFVSDGTGSSRGAQAQNIKFLNAGSGIIGASTSGIGLQAIPNYQATLNIRFTHDSQVKTQNCELRIYDRFNIKKAASGVTTKVAEIIHPRVTQTATGSGDSQWITPAGSGVVVSFANSPGVSGVFAGDGVTTISTVQSKRHDWYAAISASPDSIGNKTQYGLFFALEYL